MDSHYKSDNKEPPKSDFHGVSKMIVRLKHAFSPQHRLHRHQKYKQSVLGKASHAHNYLNPVTQSPHHFHPHPPSAPNPHLYERHVSYTSDTISIDDGHLVVSSVSVESTELVHPKYLRDFKKNTSSEPWVKLQKDLAKKGEKWTDPEFPPTLLSLYKDPTKKPPNDHVAKFLRISEFCTDPQLFVNGVEPGDVLQGALGDCWLLGPLSVIASNSKILFKLFHTKEYNPQGVYALRIFKKGEWVDVMVDDFIPCDEKGMPAYGRCLDKNEIWVMILEKAMAKLNRCYEALNDGSEANAFLDFTGMPPEEIRLKQFDADHERAFEFLYERFEKGHLLGCVAFQPGEKPESKKDQMGILLNHAYGLLQVSKTSFGEKLIKLRNPWGRGEWKGKWSDKSETWSNPKIREELNFVDEDDGSFWMCAEDFIKYYNIYYVCKILSENWFKAEVRSHWDNETSGGCPDTNPTTWLNNPQYGFTLDKATDLEIMLTQPDMRSRRDIMHSKYNHIGIYLLKTQDPLYKVIDIPDDVVIFGHKFFESRETTLETTLPPGSYSIMPCTYKIGIHTPFQISIFSSEKILNLHKCEDWEPIEVSGSWKGVTAGGCFNHPRTCMNNPQFLLIPTQEQHLPKINIKLHVFSQGKEYPCVGFYILQLSGLVSEKIESVQDVIKEVSTGFIDCDIHSELEVKRGEYYIIIPCTFQPGIEALFTLSLLMRSQENRFFSLKELPAREKGNFKNRMVEVKSNPAF